MATIYRKTDKGQHEIATREHRLPPRLRTALIMVDGKRADAELRALIAQQADETLGALLEQGFIEVAAVLDLARARAPAPVPAPAAAKAAPAKPEASRADFAAVRRDAVRALIDQVGPMGEALAVRMEQAASADALKPLLELAGKVIANTRGAKAAGEYYERFTAALDR
jgi:hypothetical protein